MAFLRRWDRADDRSKDRWTANKKKKNQRVRSSRGPLDRPGWERRGSRGWGRRRSKRRRVIIKWNAVSTISRLSRGSSPQPGLVSFVLGYLPSGIIPPSRRLLIRPSLSNAIRRQVLAPCCVAHSRPTARARRYRESEQRFASLFLSHFFEMRCYLHRTRPYLWSWLYDRQ